MLFRWVLLHVKVVPGKNLTGREHQEFAGSPELLPDMFSSSKKTMLDKGNLSKGFQVKALKQAWDGLISFR